MPQTVDVGERRIAAYERDTPPGIMEELRERAEDLRGARVLHLNATPYGGGVSELLRSAVPLYNDLGLEVEWQVIAGDEAFFSATKTLHNALQGAERSLTAEQREAYLANAERNAAELPKGGWDFIVVHDPQPAGIRRLRDDDAHWIWRCHIDTSSPNPDAWAFLTPLLEGYEAAVFTMADFLPPGFPVPNVDIIPPAIDPLSPKNLELPREIAANILDWIGVETDRPLVTQISRFDPWKDPLGVIAAYRLAREEVPDLQLALAGSMALDDPQGWEIYRQIEAEAHDDPGMHVFTNMTGVGNIEVNAFQRLSDVVVQKSIREGFGLVVTEAMWKATPVVAGRACGIPLQTADGCGGLLVESVEACAEGIVRLLRDRELARELGERGRARARAHFLLPRLLLNELSLMLDLVRGEPVGPATTDSGVDRDPVCGLAIERSAEAPEAEHEGRVFRFCSRGCRARFAHSPGRYARHPGAPAAGTSTPLAEPGG